MANSVHIVNIVAFSGEYKNSHKSSFKAIFVPPKPYLATVGTLSVRRDQRAVWLRCTGWVIAKDYGNLTHGYCVTSYASQSKGVDRVFVAESSESFRAADRQQFYVSVSRFKEALTIYTDDKEQLLEAVSKSSERPSATDLVKRQLADTNKNTGAEMEAVQQTPDASAEEASKKEIQASRKMDVRRQPPKRSQVKESSSRGVSI